MIWTTTVAIGLKVEEDKNRLEAELQELENRKQLEYLEKQIEDEKKRADARVEERIAKEQKVPQIASVSLAGVEQWRPLVSKYDWPIDSALAIMKCESGGNTNNHNYNPKTKDDSWGLYQVNIWGGNARTRPPATELVKPEVNIDYAYKLWSGPKRFGTKGGWYNCSRKLGIS